MFGSTVYIDFAFNHIRAQGLACRKIQLNINVHPGYTMKKQTAMNNNASKFCFVKMSLEK